MIKSDLIKPDISLCPYPRWQTSMYINWCRCYVLGYLEREIHVIYECASPRLPEAQKDGYSKGLEAGKRDRYLAEKRKEDDDRWRTDPLRLSKFFFVIPVNEIWNTFWKKQPTTPATP